jgi:MATE family multidrug resistance protein
VPFIAAFQFAAPVLRAFRQPEEIVPIASSFVRANAASVPAFFVFTVLRQTLQGMNIVRPVTIAVIVGNVVNTAGDLVLIFGRFGLPALGAVGAGWATTGSRFVTAIVLALAAAQALGPARRRPRQAERVFELSAYVRMLAIGIPIGLQYGLESWVFITVSLIMGSMGPLVLAGHQIAINLASLSFMVPLGVGAAAAVRVGNAIGRRDLVGARRSALVSLAAGASVMVVSACAFGFAPRLLARVYTPDQGIIESAALLLPIAALFQIFDGTQAVGCGVLRGCADTRAAAIINLVGYWLLGLPLGLVLAYRFHLGPRGLWWGLTAGLAIVAVLLVARVRSRFSNPALLDSLSVEKQ